MRRGLAGLILGLALVVASVSWASFIMSRTILDPGRSERLADQIFENPELRGVLADRLAVSVGAALPGEVAIPSDTLTAAADLALENEAVQDLVRTAIVDTHRSALEGDVQPVVIDGTALGNALRDSIVEINPALESAIPLAPDVSVELPTTGLNILGTLRDFVDRFTILSAAAALLGGAVSLVVTSNRPAVLRRVAFWAFGAAAFWLVVGYGVPWVASLIGPASSALVTAAIDVFFGAMIPPAIVMAIVGGGLLLLSFLWEGMAARQPAAVAQPDRVARRTGPKGSAHRIAGAAPSPTSPLPQQPIPHRPVDQTVVQPTPYPSGSSAHGGSTVPNAPPSARPGPGAVSPSHDHSAAAASSQHAPNAPASHASEPSQAEESPWALRDSSHSAQSSERQRGTPGNPRGRQAEESPWANNTSPAAFGEPEPSPRRWVEGVGYVDDESAS